MFNISFNMKKSLQSIIISFTTCLTLTPSHAATSLLVGDISIIGYSADSPDQIAFVSWVDLDASTQISFTDRGWRSSTNVFTKNPSEQPGSSGLVPSDGDVVWTSGTAISAGDVIVGTIANSNPDTVSWSVGSSTGDFGHTAFSSGGESIFAYQGTNATPSLIFGLYYDNTAWESTDPGEYSTGPSELPNVLNTSVGNIVVPTSTANDNGFYSGGMTGKTNLLDYRADVLDNSKWTVSNTTPTDDLATQLGASSFAVPEPSSVALLGAGFLLLTTRRTRK